MGERADATSPEPGQVEDHEGRGRKQQGHEEVSEIGQEDEDQVGKRVAGEVVVMGRGGGGWGVEGIIVFRGGGDGVASRIREDCLLRNLECEVRMQTRMDRRECVG